MINKRNRYILPMAGMLMISAPAMAQIQPNRLFMQQGLGIVLNNQSSTMGSMNNRPGGMLPGNYYPNRFPNGFNPGFYPGFGGGLFGPSFGFGYGYNGGGNTFIFNGVDSPGPGGGNLSRPSPIFEPNPTVMANALRQPRFPERTTPFNPPVDVGPRGGSDVATIAVTVPENATVFLEGQKMLSDGGVRRYTTPRLAPGKEFLYAIRVTWEENGKVVERNREITIGAGDRVNLIFLAVPDGDNR